MTIGERIKARRIELGLSAEEVARKIGKDRSTVYRYESNDIVKLPTTVLEPLARALNTTPAELMGYGDNEKYIRLISSSSASSDEEPGSFWYRYIPYAVSAGRFDDCAPLDSLPLISIPDVLLGKYARDPRLVMMHVNGESMNRVIENGATIAVLTDVPRASLQNGDIVIACHDGEGYTVKRFYDLPEDHQIILSPDSSDPRFLPIPIPYDTTDDLHIFGKVVMYSVIL